MLRRPRYQVDDRMPTHCRLRRNHTPRLSSLAASSSPWFAPGRHVLEVLVIELLHNGGGRSNFQLSTGVAEWRSSRFFPGMYHPSVIPRRLSTARPWILGMRPSTVLTLTEPKAFMIVGWGLCAIPVTRVTSLNHTTPAPLLEVH